MSPTRSPGLKHTRTREGGRYVARRLQDGKTGETWIITDIPVVMFTVLSSSEYIPDGG